jgi:hypothetical protein
MVVPQAPVLSALAPNVPLTSVGSPSIIASPVSMSIPYAPQIAKIGEGMVAIFNSRAMSFFLLTVSIVIIMSMLRGFIINVATLFGTAFLDTWNYTINSVQKNLL